MLYKIVWGGILLFVLSGVVFLGTKGINVARRSVQMEVSTQNFFNKTAA
jgi:hypothetical protein